MVETWYIIWLAVIYPMMRILMVKSLETIRAMVETWYIMVYYMVYCHLSHDENPYGEATCPS